MKLASDQRTTTATSSFVPSWRTRSVTSNSAGVRAVLRDADGLAVEEHVEQRPRRRRSRARSGVDASRAGRRTRAGRCPSGSRQGRSAAAPRTASRRSCSAAGRSPASSRATAPRPCPSLSSGGARWRPARGDPRDGTPTAVEELVELRARVVEAGRELRRRERDERRARLQPVQARQLRALPAPDDRRGRGVLRVRTRGRRSRALGRRFTKRACCGFGCDGVEVQPGAELAGGDEPRHARRAPG